jgi:diaminopropionate ammonia-lyase
VQALINGGVRRDRDYRGPFDDAAYRDVHAYFAAHPELPPAPLRSLPARAAALGLGALVVKDESARFGLNAFKIVGVRYAVHRLGDAAAARGLVCATAGNHGRAVARAARDKRVPCTVFVPRARPGAPSGSAAAALESAVRASRVAAMRADGATVVDVEGTYEDAVRHAAAHAARTGATVVSDTSWPGYDEIPRWIMAGYTQIFEEAYAQWDATPDVVVVQGGVGGLLCAAASWLAWRFGAARPRLVCAEPDGAACLLASARAGRPVTLAGPLVTMMSGLRCAEPSPAAWPAISAGVDAFLSVSDAAVLAAIDGLRHPVNGDPAIDPGPSGACGAAVLAALAADAELADVRGALDMDRSTRALVVISEGR